MNSSDEEILDKLASSLVLLEDIENQIAVTNERLIQEPDNRKLVLNLQTLNDTASNLRSDISRYMRDLGITRAQRESEQENDVVEFIETIKTAAKKFAEMRNILVFCDSCNYLVAQVWFKNPKAKGNRLTVKCDKCGNVISFSPYKHGDSVYPKNYKRVPQYL